MDNQSLQKKRKYVGLEKLPNGFLLALINKIAAAFRVELSEATLAVYLECLTEEGYSVVVKSTEPEAIVDLKHWMEDAVWRVITEWNEASKMPPLRFILDRFTETGDKKPAQFVEFPKQLEAKPDDWGPIPPAERAKMAEEAISRAAAVKGMDAPSKTLHEHQRATALQRLGGSTAPVQPRITVEPGQHAARPEALEANREWAHDMAEKNGWIRYSEDSDATARGLSLLNQKPED